MPAPQARRTEPRRRAKAGRRWSKQVVQTSDALDLEPRVFKRKSPRAIALSLKRSAERSTRRKSPPFRSAMSMLTFYVNRGGKNLGAAEKKRLLRAKDELRKLFHRSPKAARKTTGRRSA
ncbi:MAG TPA: DUF3175 domain-containing protein [Polyangia bacterium]|nr:DUF3175 domain-containing protein [Polyangia bacterium]